MIGALVMYLLGMIVAFAYTIEFGPNFSRPWFFIVAWPVFSLAVIFGLLVYGPVYKLVKGRWPF